MKNKVIIIALTLIVAVLFFYGREASNENLIAVKEQPEKTTKKDIFSDDVFAYSVNIESAVLTEKQAVITHSNLNWNMYFSELSQATLSNAVIENIQFINNKKRVELPSSLSFRTKYVQNKFMDIDLLSLPENHTLNVLNKVLELMSYSTQTQLSFTDMHGEKRYEYKVKTKDVIERVLVNNKAITDGPENNLDVWSMKVDSLGYPISLEHQTESTWSQEQATYNVVQKVTVERISKKLIAFKSITENENAKLIMKSEDSIVHSITDQASLLEALAKLKENLDPSLAKAIGEYLLKEYDINELLQWLKDDPQMSSALIYALQKEQSIQAEQMLSDITTAENLNDKTKLKVIIALGRFGNSSDISLQALKDIATDKEQNLSGSAILNLGSLAKYTPEQKTAVSEFLEEHLENKQSLPSTILAIENSQIEELYPKVAELLNTGDVDVQISAIKVLSKHTDYQNDVINTLSKKPQAQTVDAFVRVMMSQKVTLTEQNKEILISMYHSTTNPIIKKRLEELEIV